MNKNAATYQDALNHAQSSQSMRNYDAIMEGFMEMGIDEKNIEPRENVLTYKAWLALGRRVKVGQHGVKIVTFIPRWNKKTKEKEKGVRPWSSTVFHISQTSQI